MSAATDRLAWLEEWYALTSHAGRVMHYDDNGETAVYFDHSTASALDLLDRALTPCTHPTGPTDASRTYSASIEKIVLSPEVEAAAHARHEGRRAAHDAHQQLADHDGDIVRAYLDAHRDLEDESTEYICDVCELLESWMDSAQRALLTAPFAPQSLIDVMEAKILRRLALEAHALHPLLAKAAA